MNEPLKIGRVVDKLTLVRESLKKDKTGHLRRYWECKCECGNTTIKRDDSLSKRKHLSCGCNTSTLQAANARRIKWKGVGELSSTFFTACKRSAKKRHIEFQISIWDAWQQFVIQNGKCALSGVPIKLSETTRHGHKYGSASIDRIDSSKGYTTNNIQWVHKTINTMKNVLEQNDFLEWCNKVTTHNNERISR